MLLLVLLTLRLFPMLPPPPRLLVTLGAGSIHGERNANQNTYNVRLSSDSMQDVAAEEFGWVPVNVAHMTAARRDATARQRLPLHSSRWGIWDAAFGDCCAPALEGGALEREGW